MHKNELDFEAHFQIIFRFKSNTFVSLITMSVLKHLEEGNMITPHLQQDIISKISVHFSATFPATICCLELPKQKKRLK